MTERILILSIDIDNDLYQKTGISGPVIGRNANLSAASKLALADPLDPDSNVMFEAVKKFDNMKAEEHVAQNPKPTSPQQQREKAEIKVGEPLLFWVMMLVIGLFLIVIPNIGAIPTNTAAMLLEVGKAIIYIPGAIILPLIISLWVAEKIGAVNRPSKSILSLSMLNASYVFLVYIIAIFIIFLLAKYFSPNLVAVSVASFLIYLVALPFVILFVLVPLLSLLSSARHNV